MRFTALAWLAAFSVSAASAPLVCAAGGAAPAASGYHSENFELTEEDLADITAQVMADNPLLSSSPGIKYAGATRHRHTHDVATLIYYPHLETVGIKQAFQVTCEREVPELSWSCEQARIRRYLALDSQQFEVRVTGPLSPDEAMTLIEATRRALPAQLEDGSAAPDTAVMIRPYRDRYLVTWGIEPGYGKLVMQATLPEGAIATIPGNWQVGVYSPD